MELFAADGHDAGGCERVTGKSECAQSYYYASIALVASVTGSMLRGRTLARTYLHLDGCIIRRLPRYP